MTNRSPGPGPHEELARLLKSQNEMIIEKWTKKAREKIHSAEILPQLALRDSLPAFLDRLADTLLPEEKSKTIEAAGRAGREHGEDRALKSNYEISEVLLEYWILRDVIFQTLETELPLPISARDLMLAAFDQAIRCAVEEFSSERSRVLQQSNLDLEHFAAIAAHDLKSPLATISGYLEVVEEGFEQKAYDEILSYIKTAKRAAGQMSVMIDRLLTYSAVGRDRGLFELVSMKEIVDDVLLRLQPAVYKAKVTIEVGDLPQVIGEKALLCMLVQNLISNAIKFRADKEPRIVISAREEAKSWVFSIMDNGLGFDPKHADHLFSLFKQFHKNAKSAGFGIGLATAKKVVDLHGGRIWARSQPGAGSTFFFSIPF